MRPIKFRAWDFEFKIMREWEWIEKVRWPFYSEGGTNLLKPQDFALMQFIGVLDRNGKEIYDGDIIKNDVLGGQIYTVQWIDQITGFYFSVPNTHRGRDILSCAASQSDGLITLNSIEIIGNIYKNPELLISN